MPVTKASLHASRPCAAHVPASSPAQAVATIVSACARMRTPVRDAALLQTLCDSALSR